MNLLCKSKRGSIYSVHAHGLALNLNVKKDQTMDLYADITQQININWCRCPKERKKKLNKLIVW